MVAMQQLRRSGKPAAPAKQPSVEDMEKQLGIGEHDDIQAELDQMEGTDG